MLYKNKVEKQFFYEMNFKYYKLIVSKPKNGINVVQNWNTEIQKGRQNTF
jgi:hypothetical protein